MNQAEGMERWRGSVALVTGASSGIGAAIASALYEVGLKVAVCARRMSRLEELKGQLDAEDSRFLAIQVDLRDESSIDAMFSKIRAKWGGVDVLVNNAGLGHNSSLLDGETEAWREMLELNVLALCICTREAARDMRRQGRPGHIFHISSMSAHRVPRASGVYSASKYAVRSLTEGLRKELVELNSGIRVTSISPGFVETEFAEHYYKSEEVAQEIYTRFKTLQPQDIAQTVCFALGAPEHMQIHDILMRPTSQES